MIDEILCKSCIDFLNECEKGAFDYVITSPPYNGPRFYENGVESRYDVYNDEIDCNEYLNFIGNLFYGLHSKMNDCGIVALNIGYHSSDTMIPYKVLNKACELGFELVDTICWVKNNSMPHPASGVNLQRIWEFVFIFCKKGLKNCVKTNASYNIGLNGQKYYKPTSNIIYARNNDGTCKLNKATYSSEFVEKLLDIYVPEGKIVYDPFMGTGTTAIACKMGNRHFIGTEISEEQVKFANSRLSKICLKERNEFDLF